MSRFIQERAGGCFGLTIFRIRGCIICAGIYAKPAGKYCAVYPQERKNRKMLRGPWEKSGKMPKFISRKT